MSKQGIAGAISARHGLEALRRGDATPLRHCLESGAPLDLQDWQAAWYRTWTLVGGLEVVPLELWGDDRKSYEWALFYTRPRFSGGPQRRLGNLEELRSELIAALSVPLTRSRHQQGLLRCLRAALDRELTGVQVRNVIGLARHHTDLAVDELSGWDAWCYWDEVTGWSQFCGALLAANRSLLEWLASFVDDDVRFAGLLEEGVRSRSRPRRELCESLRALAC
jgi:hypothetical protein